MSSAFEFWAPTRVFFGVGQTREVLPRLLAGSECGVLSSPSVMKLSGIAHVLDHCASQGVTWSLLGTVSPNPRVSEVQTALEVARERRISDILAVGGGSVIDAGKVLASAYRYGVTAREILDELDAVRGREAERECGLTVVPTTAGTGAEVSRGAILTDERARSKRAARGKELVPNIAVIDPALTLSLPPRRTAETGFDVIAHAVETFLSRASNPLTDILALAALAAAPEALLRAIDRVDDLSARTTLSQHAWLMGYNLAHASTCLPHRMQYPVGALTDTSHQVGLAALYPEWLRRVATHSPSRVRTVLHLVGESMARAGVSVPPDSVFDTLLERLGLDVSLSELGVEPKDIPFLVSSVDGRLDLDPMSPGIDDVEQIFRASLG